MVERCPDKTEVDGSIPSTLTKFKFASKIFLYYYRRKPQEFLRALFFVENHDEKLNKPSAHAKPNWAPAMQIMSEVSTWIVVPILLALIFGKMLDSHFGTKPIIFLCLTGVGFLVTCFGMFRVIKNYIQKLKEEERKK